MNEGRDARRRADSGRRAEALAGRYLESRGFVILEKNARAGRGEIDLVARDGEEIVFVEVRCRRRGSRFAPEATLGRRQRMALAEAAARWLATRGLGDARCRFDLVAVVEGRGGFRVRHLPGAFVVEGAAAWDDTPGRPERDAPER